MADNGSNQSGQTPEAIAVPNVVGFSVQAAEFALRSVGLRMGTQEIVQSHLIVSGAVSSTTPGFGTKVAPSSEVILQISDNPVAGRGGILQNYRAQSASIFISVVGFAVLCFLMWGMFSRDFRFISLVSDSGTARGLITFLIAFVTVSMALILDGAHTGIIHYYDG